MISTIKIGVKEILTKNPTTFVKVTFVENTPKIATKWGWSLKNINCGYFSNVYYGDLSKTYWKHKKIITISPVQLPHSAMEEQCGSWFPNYYITSPPILTHLKIVLTTCKSSSQMKNQNCRNGKQTTGAHTLKTKTNIALIVIPFTSNISTFNCLQ